MVTDIPTTYEEAIFRITWLQHRLLKGQSPTTVLLKVQSLPCTERTQLSEWWSNVKTFMPKNASFGEIEKENYFSHISGAHEYPVFTNEPCSQVYVFREYLRSEWVGDLENSKRIIWQSWAFTNTAFCKTQFLWLLYRILVKLSLVTYIL